MDARSLVQKENFLAFEHAFFRPGWLRKLESLYLRPWPNNSVWLFPVKGYSTNLVTTAANQCIV